DLASKQVISTFMWRKEKDMDLYPVATKENGLPVLIPVRGYSLIPDRNVTTGPGVSESVIRINEYLGGSCCNEFLHRVVMKDCSEKAGKVISRETVIFDCTGMGLHQFHMPAINLMKMMTDMDLSYYPETLGKLFLVNTPSTFVYLWKIVKTWLDAGTIDKVKILGTDYQSTLLEYIPAENLPSYLGGTCTCDHMPGGCVPSQGKIVAGKDNHKVPTAYNTAIMEKAKESKELRGLSDT
ncbi:CRAL-TRIO domain-containing protein, partial [Chlamydoabsidia padenii]